MTAADDQIRLCIDKGQSFVMDAGAGSGKTTSLVEALRYLLASPAAANLARTSQKIACITFTNVAANEIIERTGHNPLIQVSTIHDFIWRIIRGHQKELKEALLKHNDVLEGKSTRKRDHIELASALEHVAVNYSDRGPEFLEGRIFHDDLIDVGLIMFQDNPMLSNIVVARNPFILVDEYQDTSRAVIEILLDYVLKKNLGKVFIGLFGDKFQNIYHGGPHSGIGEIPLEQRSSLIYITKEENYRCSDAVIAVLNKIRVDLKQTAAGKNEKGKAVYIRLATKGGGNDPVAHARALIREKLGLDFTTGSQKELYLTHKLIARKARYERLLDVYQKRGGFFRDRLLNGEDKLIDFFRSWIEPLIAAWRNGQCGKALSILRAGGFQLNDNESKVWTKKVLDELVDMQMKATIRVVLSHINSAGLAILPDDLKKALEVKPEDIKSSTLIGEKEDGEALAAEYAFYLEFMGTPYSEISGFCRFLDEHTPFSTKHGVKGTEFDTVFVVLDDKGAKWNQYAFDKYLSGEDEEKGMHERAHRTRNLFYVCCSRVKKNLVLIDLGAGNSRKDARLLELFGAENCFL